MRSFLKILAATTFMVIMFSGCTKDNDPQTNATIEGLWIGTYTVDGYPNLGQQYFSFIIKPDGTMINDTKAENKQHIALGTWTLTGNAFSSSFKCIYGLPVNIGITETSTATLDKAGKLTGTWSNIAPLTGGGTITLTKVPE